MRGLVPPLLAVLLSLASSVAGLAQPARERFLRDWLVEGHGEEVLFRPVDILVTNGCQVWVADAGNARIYRWGCDGRVLPALGRKGEGPGEFGQPSVLEAMGRDTVAVWDRPTQRMTLYSDRGTVLRSERMGISGGEHGFVRAIGRAAPVTLVATDNYAGGLRRPNESFSFLWAVDGDGNVGHAVLRRPGPETFIERSATASASVDAPFRRRPVILFERGGTVLVGNTGTGRMARYRTGARLVPGPVIELGIAPLPVTRAERAAWTDSVRAVLASELERSPVAGDQAASLRRMHEDLLEKVVFPDTRNHYLLATLDGAGNVWVQLDVVLPNGASRWQVHRAGDGRRLRVIDVPTRGQVKAAAATASGLYVIEVGDDGVARVGRYAPPARARR